MLVRVLSETVMAMPKSPAAIGVAADLAAGRVEGEAVRPSGRGPAIRRLTIRGEQASDVA